MNKLIPILLLQMFSRCILTQKLEYPIFFAEDICNEKIIIGREPNNSSFVIKLMKNNSSKTIKSCKVEIQSNNDQKIHTNIKKMVDLYNSKGLKSHNTITFNQLNENRLIIIQFNGLGDDIQLVVTAYKSVIDGQNCPKYYFLCEKNKCIHEIYRCDSYYNCANDENELACALDLTPGNTVLLTIILAILSSLFGTTCLLSSYIFYHYYQKERSLLDTKQKIYGTVNTSTPASVQHSMKVFK